jgi:hypothetical protein
VPLWEIKIAEGEPSICTWLRDAIAFQEEMKSFNRLNSLLDGEVKKL